MDNNTEVQLSTELIQKLENLAGGTISQTIELLISENDYLKNKPSNYLVETKVSAKDNKNKKGEVTSVSYSTAIPKPILKKYGLTKGQLLYWDIDDDNNIVITPEVQDLPETKSIEAGNEILNDILFNGTGEYYTTSLQLIKTVLNNEKPNIKTKKEKIDYLVNYYNDILGDKRQGIIKYNQNGFKQVVLYLLDYPLNKPAQYKILKAVYEEITK